MYALSENPTHMFELLELLRYQFDQIDFIDEPVDVGFDCPLDLHCSYTRDQLLVALDFLKPGTVREGVKWLPDKKIDVLFVTLNKSDKDYSPTTMYEDYSISEELFHWQSQSTTSADSPTSQRYINHEARGSRVLLFVREFKQDRVLDSAAAYTFLGCARYVSHEGSRPMSITWALDRPIPPSTSRRPTSSWRGKRDWNEYPGEKSRPEDVIPSASEGSLRLEGSLLFSHISFNIIVHMFYYVLY